jgi:hypothetical protein
LVHVEEIGIVVKIFRSSLFLDDVGSLAFTNLAFLQRGVSKMGMGTGELPF